MNAIHSSPTISNPDKILEHLKCSLRLARAKQHRVMLVLYGAPEPFLTDIGHTVQAEHQGLQAHYRKATALVIQNQTAQALAALAHVPDKGTQSDVSDQINALLGTENCCLFFDARDNFNERLFAASAGTVIAGGLLVLLAPAFDAWGQGTANGKNHSGFLKRFAQKIEYHKTASWSVLSKQQENVPDYHARLIGETNPEIEALANEAREKEAYVKETHEEETQLDTIECNETDSACLAEQHVLVAKIVNELQKETKSTIVVQADRGRGKSTIIGRSLKTLLENSYNKTITITANRKSACEILLKHANIELENNNAIRFLPADQAVAIHHDLLVVEEAGSLSLPVLTQLSNQSENLIFATTVQGYEGAGRGFALRFSKQLDQLRPEWMKLSPTFSVRWAFDDPIEAFVNDALLLKTELPNLNNGGLLDASLSELHKVNIDNLINDEVLLADLYALLIQAHYQTTPADLRHLLEQRNLEVYVQRTEEIITGAALVAIEGEIENELHADIVNKKRRLPDQILPQLLAQSVAEPETLSMRFARVIRIAVHPSLHRQGFGTKLLSDLRDKLKPNVDVIGSSFGADELTLSFWLKQGYTPIHYGYKANPRSGLQSACVLLAHNDKATTITNLAKSILHNNLRALNQHAMELNRIEQSLIDSTMATNTATDNAAIADQPSTINDTKNQQLLNDFCHFRRSFNDSVGSIGESQMKNLLENEATAQSMKSLLNTEKALAPKQRRAAEQTVREYCLAHLL